jgi:hypothetical protein
MDIKIKIADTELVQGILEDFIVLAKSVVGEANTSMTKDIAYRMIEKYTKG